MPWKVSSPMSIREEFVSLARVEGANVKELCARFGISCAGPQKLDQLLR